MSGHTSPPGPRQTTTPPARHSQLQPPIRSSLARSLSRLSLASVVASNPIPSSQIAQAKDRPDMKSRRQSSGGSPAEGATTHSGGGAGKMERKDVEKNRRLHMKGLCLKLSSLLPPAAKHASLLSAAAAAAASSNPNKDTVTQLDHLDNATAYIKQLKARIDELKRRKEAGGGGGGLSTSTCNGTAAAAAAASGGVRMPVIEVRHREGTLDVALVSDSGRPFRLHEVITVLEQEGAEVVSASFSVVGDKIFYTIHSQAASSRVGLQASRVSERLQELVVLV